MNRYIAEGMVADLLAGKYVLFMTVNRDAIADAMGFVLATGRDAQLFPTGLGVHRTHGHESIRAGAGRIDFTSVHSSHDGLCCPDVVVVDCDDYGLDSDWWKALTRAVGRRAELIRR